MQTVLRGPIFPTLMTYEIAALLAVPFNADRIACIKRALGKAPALLERLYCVEQNAVAVCLAMPERSFIKLEADLEGVLLRLKATEDPKVRRELLMEMRRLLAEADRGGARPTAEQTR